MRFRRWSRPTAYGDTSRKRAAFLRKQRLERETLPLFAAQIGARQHGVDEEKARRAEWWDDYERDRRNQRAARWREARARLFALDDALRLTIRKLWRTCPYPADPASFADMLHQIAVGRLDPHRAPWIFHQETPARISTNPTPSPRRSARSAAGMLMPDPRRRLPWSRCSAAISGPASSFLLRVSC